MEDLHGKSTNLLYSGTTVVGSEPVLVTLVTKQQLWLWLKKTWEEQITEEMS